MLSVCEPSLALFISISISSPWEPCTPLLLSGVAPSAQPEAAQHNPERKAEIKVKPRGCRGIRFVIFVYLLIFKMLSDSFYSHKTLCTRDLRDLVDHRCVRAGHLWWTLLFWG